MRYLIIALLALTLASPALAQLYPLSPPFKLYTTTAGAPLNNGYVYFGTANQNPETSPTTVYWDSAGLLPVAQPVRTVNGYPSRQGTPTNVFTSGDVSITVRDSRGALVYTSPRSTDYLLALSIFAQPTGADLIGIADAGAYYTSTTVEDALQEAWPLTANTAGRARMAAGYFAADATSRGKFADSFVTGALIATQNVTNTHLVKSGTSATGASAAVSIDTMRPDTILSGVSGLEIRYGSATSATIICAGAALTDGTNWLYVKNVSRSVNLATTGVDAFDTGSPANSSSVHWFIIAKDDGTTRVLGSASPTSPTMPSGYTYKRRVGSIRLGMGAASASLPHFSQMGNRIVYGEAWVVTSADLTASAATINVASDSPDATIPCTSTARIVIVRTITTRVSGSPWAGVYGKFSSISVGQELPVGSQVNATTASLSVTSNGEVPIDPATGGIAAYVEAGGSMNIRAIGFIDSI